MANNIEFDTSKKFLDYDGLKTYHAKLMEYIADSQSGLVPDQKYVVNADTEGNHILIADPEQNWGDFDPANGSYIDITNGGLTIACNASDDVGYPYGVIAFENNDDNETTLSVGIVNVANYPHISIDRNVLELSNGDNVLSIIDNDNDSGLYFNNSKIITEKDIPGVLCADEDGVVNKSELTIGNFEIKNDKPYNYTFYGVYNSEHRLADEDISIIAEYNHEGAKLKTITWDDGSSEDMWCYEFIVTDFSLWEDADEDYIEQASSIIGLVLNIPAAFLDSDYEEFANIRLLNFIDDKSENLNFSGSTDETSNSIMGYFIRTAPFSLRYTSKALLNGSPVMTADTLASSDIVSGLNNKITNKADKSYVDENFVVNKSDNDYDIVIGNDAGVDIVGMYYDGADTVTCECKLGENAGGVEISTQNDAIPSKGKITVNGDDIIMVIEDYQNNLDTADYHKVSLNNNGFTYKDSPIVTLANADELNILKTDEDGVVNKSELTIGSFVIKEDKPFNYTLRGTIQSDDYEIYFTAEYNKKSAKYVEQEWYNYDWEQEGVYQGYVYTFVVTEASSSDEHELPGESFIGQEITVPAYMIDSDYGDYYEETRSGDSYVTHLDFSESDSHVITLPYCGLENYQQESTWPLTCTITESAPFALRKTSKVTLNGKPIVTNDILANTESNIIKDINKKLENFVNTSKSATSSISLDESGESYNIIKSTTSFRNGGTYLNMSYTHDVLDAEDHDVHGQKTSSITNNKDGIIMSNERSGGNTDLWSGFVDADKSQVKVSDDSISFIVEDYEVTYGEESHEPDGYIVKPKTVKLDKESFTYNDKQIATEDYVNRTEATLKTSVNNKADKSYVESLEKRIKELEDAFNEVFKLIDK